MRVGAVNNHSKRVNRQVVQSAKMGALLTGGTIAATQAYHWISKPETMKKIVLDNGGKLPYIRNLLMATALYTALGATLSALVSRIAEKTKPIEHPRAGN